MKISVCGIGLVTAIGDTPDQVLVAIESHRRGVGRLTLFESQIDVPVAEVKSSNEGLKQALGIDPKQTISRTALLGMAAASKAMADARIPTGARVGLVSSTSVGGMDLTENFYREFSQDNAKGRLRDVRGHDCSDSTQKIADYCGIKGFTTTISTACSSAANAVILGARLLETHRLDYVVVGGTDALCRFTLNGFNSLMILDPNPCRPFDRDRAGLNLGEGAAYLVLTRASSESTKSYCTLGGYANANDAFHQTASSANGEGAYRAMSQAIAMSGLTPVEIDYINVHGTGTQNNDASEGAAIARLFGDSVPRFSSTKPYTGHTLAAAGAIEAVLSVLAIERGVIYPNLGFSNPIEGTNLTPELEFRSGAELRHVMSNSFGFGGNNTTLIFSKTL